MTKSKLEMLALAEAQLLGFHEGVMGCPVNKLLSAMDLKKEEWEKLKNVYGMEYLSQGITKDIEQYFNPHQEQ